MAKCYNVLFYGRLCGVIKVSGVVYAWFLGFQVGQCRTVDACFVHMIMGLYEQLRILFQRVRDLQRVGGMFFTILSSQSRDHKF